MKTLTEQLAQYAAYHRDRRNIATHFVGIPLIVIALAILLARPAWAPGGLPVVVTPARVLFVAVPVYYLLLDVPLGVAMAVLAGLCIGAGEWVARQSTLAWLGSGAGLFVIGWIFQFIGHIAYEHRKPAFIDDVIGLLIGPLFVLVETLGAGGWRAALRNAVEAVAGPTRINRH